MTKLGLSLPRTPSEKKKRISYCPQGPHCRAPSSLVLRTVGATLCGLVDKATSDKAVAQVLRSAIPLRGTPTVDLIN